MYERINEAEFIRRFDEFNRLEQFSLRGLEALFAYLTDLEEQVGTEMELDVIGLCCDYCDYDSAMDALSEVDPEEHDRLLMEYPAHPEVAEDDALRFLQDECAVVLEHNDGVIISN